MNNFSEIIERIKKLLVSPNPSSESWVDIMTFLQLLKPDLVSEARAREVIANKKFREIRKEHKSRVDAEDAWKTEPEYISWVEAKDRLEELNDWQKVASRQVSAKYKNF